MRKIIPIVLFMGFYFSPNQMSGAMMGYNVLELDFTKPKEIKDKVIWSNANKLTLHKNGLGFDGPENTSVELTLETTKPFAIGYSWRPIQSAGIEVEITPPRQPISLPHGQTSMPFIGNFFVRYSPDAKHWSSWQSIEGIKVDINSRVALWKFRGQIGVPRKERERYQDYLYEYQEMDVPWTSDEEAAVKWILSQDPDFFKKQIPFIGYLQFLFETNLYGGQRIKNIKISVGYGVSGLHAIPKDKKYQRGRSEIPW